MEIIINIILPVLIIVAIYLLMRIIIKKGILATGIFIKARIIMGSIGIGYFLSVALQGQNIREIIANSLIAALVLYGVIMLQNKYLYVKK